MSIEPKKSRIQYLRERVKQAEGKHRTTSPVPFRGEAKAFVVIDVDSSFPLYNIRSGRTSVAQSGYLSTRKDLDDDFFSDPEDPAVQKAQHEILLRMISLEGLDEDLRDRKQQEPVILTYDGFIVDGNRRICSIRDSGKQQYVKAVVMPEDATALEIYETELEKQQARDTKAKYAWIPELLNIRYGLNELKASKEHLSKRMRRPPEELTQDLAILDMVDLYLNWLEAPGDYYRIPEDVLKTVFTELTDKLEGKQVKKLTNASKVAIRHMCFAAIKGERYYQEVRAIVKHGSSSPRAILEKLQEDSEAATRIALVQKRVESSARKKRPTKESDPLAQLAEAEQAQTPREYVILAEAFTKPTEAEKLLPALIRATESLEDEDREVSKHKQPLELIQRSSKLLGKVELTAKTLSLERVAKALAKVAEELDRLTADVERLKKGKV